jgi:hypothetical protein
MPTSETPTADRGSAGRIAVPAALLAMNALLFAAAPWLRSLPVAADSTDRPIRILGEGPFARKSLSSESILRNPGYFSAFVDAVRQECAILYLGTSETLPRYNLGAQLNAMFPKDPSLVVLARMGSSPIHSSLLFATSQREQIATPPLVLVVNLVYFTESHDVINNGWMASLMRSDAFVQMDHRGVMENESPDVRERYARHFGLERALWPLTAQEYFANLAYLVFHQVERPAFARGSLPIGHYKFDGVIPEYDRKRGVHTDFHAADQYAKGRWNVKTVEDCNNLAGLRSAANNLARQAAPSMLLVLPVNRRFYEFNGLDMAEFDQRYAAIREEIGRLAKPGHLFVLDLYDSPVDLGFNDRMHLDAYGYRQIAERVGKDATYHAFLGAVRSYYGHRCP